MTSTLTSHNPATGDVIWQKPAGTAQDVDTAVTAARHAFAAWSDQSVESRMKVVERYRDLLTERKAIFAEAIAKEMGKPLWDAATEVGAMIGKAALSLKAYHQRTGEQVNEMGSGQRAHLMHRPHGVLAVFGPYNFPGHLPNGHIIPALIAGNTLVFKPSQLTPMIGEMMGDLWREAGLPEGVLIVIQGTREVGAALVAHPQIDGLLFTGSSHVGTLLNQQLSSQPQKIIALEMGGNNPLIIWDSPDAKVAAYHTILSAFITSGQRCTCARRLILPQGPAGDAVVHELVAMAKGLTLGAYTDSPEPFLGPLIRRQEVDEILAAQQKMQQQGGTVLLEATAPDAKLPFLTPGIMDVTAIAEREDREYFGPFLQIIRVTDFDAAIAEANNTQYGLAAAIFTQDKNLYERALRQLRAGLINWNRQTTGASGALPFGGTGVSGNHRAAGFYAADYCAYPVASIESDTLEMPETLAKGIVLPA